MADYYAVLKRTLSGFGDAKPQLRQKLYERARTTIEGQLQSRKPAMAKTKIKAELKSLEEAIATVEAEFESSDASPPALGIDDIAPIAEETSAKDTKSPASPDVDEVKIEKPDPFPEDKDWELPPLDVPRIPLSSSVSSSSGSLDTNAGATETPAGADARKFDRPPIPITDPALEDHAELTIPPAPDQSQADQKRFPVFIVGLIVAAVLALGTIGWTQREAIVALVSPGEQPPAPKPVKTIAIKPEPEKPEESPTAPANTPAEPKLEERLTGNGQNGGSQTGQTSETATGVPDAPATIVPDAANTTEPVQQLGPVVSQTAILYEEGATAAENTLDGGRVVWSVVQEAPGEGEPEEAAIRGRVEIPSRNLVLIMTLKRNTDKALPASHLIELIFAVPDDFSGGAIEEINRFVMKDSEQGRGDTLVAVPAPIAPGIFLVALNNAPTAQEKNVNLMRTKSWIDIPLQYRTGRRALVTMEKGIPGEKVFEQVFAEWDTKQAPVDPAQPAVDGETEQSQ